MRRIAEVDSATWRPGLTLKFEFELLVGVRLDSFINFEVYYNLEVNLAECLKDLDVRYGFAAVEKRDENRLDLQPERRKIEVLTDVGFVLQPIQRTEKLSNEYFLIFVEKPIANCSIMIAN